MKKNSETSVLFKVPLFEINEHDGMNTASLERSFSKAVKLMYSNKGFYIRMCREFVYTPYSRKLSMKPCEIVAFGEIVNVNNHFQFSQSKSVISALINEGVTQVVYNKRLDALIPYEENMSVFPDSLIQSFLQKTKNPYACTLVASDYTAELIGAEVAEPGFETVAEAVTALVYASNVSGFRLIKRNYFANGIVQKVTMDEIYYQDLVATHEWVVKNFQTQVSQNPKVQNAKFLVLTNNGFFIPKPNFKLMRKSSPKLWLQCIKH